MAIDLQHAKRGFYFDSWSENIWRTSQLFDTEQDARTAQDEGTLTWEVAVIRCKKCSLVVPVGKGLVSEISAECKKCKVVSTVEHKDILWLLFKDAERLVYICQREIIAGAV